MSKRNRKPTHRPFESNTEHGRFIKIADDMMRSAAWNDLSLRQRGLYLQLKAEYIPEKSRAGVITPPNDRNIIFPKSSWGPLYHGNQRAWEKDLDALIEHGFIDREESGKTTRTPNVYALSARWKEWPEK